MWCVRRISSVLPWNFGFAYCAGVDDDGERTEVPAKKKEIKMGHMSVDDDDDVSVDLGGSDIKNTANEKNIK